MNSLAAVPFNQVQLTDSFWSPRVETNRNVTLRAEYEMLRRTGRLSAWDGTWRAGDPDPPHIFWDSDIAKWIEAASYSLATHPDPELDAQLDALIAKLARLQAPDGYVNSHYQLVEPGKRWTNLRDRHELYCAGHLIEAAVAHFQATGKRSLLDVLCRYADHIDATFGREGNKRRGYCGHEEIELALVKLYHVTGERRYLDLARYFVNERGTGATVLGTGLAPGHDAPVGAALAAALPTASDALPSAHAPRQHYFDLEALARGEDPRQFWAKTYAYMQAHEPVRAQREVAGHAVRAMYLYSAMADLAREFQDAELLQVCRRLWHSVCEQQMYLSGGIGQTRATEGFTGAYDLPDESAYAETCAAAGMVFWNQRMLHLTGDGQHADVMERVLYNGLLSGVSLDGTKFFYDNPLASRGNHHRQEWFDCACCPPNLARLLANLGGYVYAQGAQDVWIHLSVQSDARLRVGGWDLGVRQQTCYPWDGAVRIELQLDAPRAFTLHLRIPGWCEHWNLRLNDAVTTRPVNVRDGYVHLHREWQPGDTVALSLAMPIRYVFAHPDVQQMVGRVALQRGPIVYCFEAADHPGVALEHIALRAGTPAHRSFRAEHLPDLLGGVMVLRGCGELLEAEPHALYASTPPRTRAIDLTAIPYFAWDNRAPGAMRVWLRRGDI